MIRFVFLFSLLMVSWSAQIGVGNAEPTTSTASRSCLHQGKRYLSGALFLAKDGCNRCLCNRGQILCSQNPCPHCVVAGRTYKHGESLPQRDGCNTCRCHRGVLYCTNHLCNWNCRVGQITWRHQQKVPSKRDTEQCRCIRGRVHCVTKPRPTLRWPQRFRVTPLNKCANFYYKICKKDQDCRPGYQCTQHSTDCRSSVCFCDPKTGAIGGCTMDCLRDFGICSKP